MKISRHWEKMQNEHLHGKVLQKSLKLMTLTLALCYLMVKLKFWTSWELNFFSNKLTQTQTMKIKQFLDQTIWTSTHIQNSLAQWLGLWKSYSSSKMPQISQSVFYVIYLRNTALCESGNKNVQTIHFYWTQILRDNILLKESHGSSTNNQCAINANYNFANI